MRLGLSDLVATELFSEQRKKKGGGGVFPLCPHKATTLSHFGMRRSVTVSPPLPPPITNKRDNKKKKTYYVVAFKIERELPSLVYLLRDLCVILMSV